MLLQTRNWRQAGHRMRLLRHTHGCMHIRKHKQTDKNVCGEQKHKNDKYTGSFKPIYRTHTHVVYETTNFAKGHSAQAELKSVTKSSWQNGNWPDELSTDGTERRLFEECRHELVSIDLMHAPLQSAAALVHRAFLLLEHSLLRQFCPSKSVTIN